MKLPPHYAVVSSLLFVTPTTSGPNILLRTIFLNTLNFVLPLIYEIKFHIHTKNTKNGGSLN